MKSFFLFLQINYFFISHLKLLGGGSRGRGGSRGGDRGGYNRNRY
jgi:hypothetical protein